MLPKICVIITSLNLNKVLEKCLDSIFKTKYKYLTIIIVDNGSKPHLQELLKPYQKKLKITFLRSNANLGFAQANNLAIKYCLEKRFSIDYFLLLNNDVILSRYFFIESIPYLKKNGDLLSPIISLTQNRGIQDQGVNYYFDGSADSRLEIKKENYLLSATSLFVSKKLALECQNHFGWFFIPLFGSYAEDSEISLRSILMKKKIILIPKKIVYHVRSLTLKDPKNICYLVLRNWFWTIITTWTNEMLKKNFSKIIVRQLTDHTIYFLKYKYIFFIRIYFQTLFSLPKLLAIRKIIQKQLVIKYPHNLFLENPITFKMHIERSRTYNKIKIKISFLKLYFQLLEVFTLREIKSRYKASLLGPLWIILYPLFSALILSVIFGIFVKIQTDNIPYFLFVLSGLSIWNFFAQGLNLAKDSLIWDRNLITKSTFPKSTLPLAYVFSKIPDFFIYLLIYLVFYFFNGYQFSFYIFFILFLILPLSLFSAGIALIFSMTNAIFRDFGRILELFLMIFFYITPIIYPESLVPSQYKFILFVNPLSLMIMSLRNLLFKNIISVDLIFYSTLISVLIFILGFLIFKKSEKKVADLI